MTAYRRVHVPGATWFFTVALARRRDNRLLVDHIDELRAAFRYVMARHPFQLDAIVILPEHLHCLWTLSPGEADFSTRWGLLKSHFSRAIPSGEPLSDSQVKRGERGLWQRRFWEHLIRDEDDYARHVDYIHWNPVKHGHVEHAGNWPHSSLHRYHREGLLPANWGMAEVPPGDFGEPLG
ncbi:MAG: transposase [Gammaproteobacteria bacterium]|nr:transposase [Gammaproteobacteria bacterium]